MAADPSKGVTISDVATPQVATALWGPKDAHRRLLERKLGVRIASRGDQITLMGPPESTQFAERVVRQLLDVVRGGSPLFLQDVDHAVRMLEEHQDAQLESLTNKVVVTHNGRSIVPKTPNQYRYLEAIERNDLVFSVGPAGTGKTYLAMATAVGALERREVKRVILARPAVEAGEKLGFLPGNLAEKVNPYLRPLYDALYDMMDVDRAGRLVENGTIEVAPLAFMRGRTLNNSFVILDEAQNTTREQMKMFLTRLGFSCRAVITGDVTQIDLPSNKESGLEHALGLLSDIEGIAIARLTDVDVVRHRLVQAIVRAYERDESS